MLEITSKEQLDESIKAEGVTVLDVYAPWCGPCKMITPALESLEQELDATFVKVNADELRPAVMELGVMTIPTILIYADGELKDKSVGYAPGSVLEDKIKAVIDLAKAE